MGHIYWIASYPKSGNTWMRAFIAAVINGGEAVDLNRLEEVVSDDNVGSFYQSFLSGPIAKATLRDLARVRPSAQRAMAASARGFLLLKTHNLLSMHQGTPTIATDVTAGAIYIVRNPLDVAVSYSAFRARDYDETISSMLESGRVLPKPSNAAYHVAGSWAENVQTWTQRRHARLLVLRYEDMLANPVACFTQAVRLLKMDVTGAVIEKAIAATRFDVLQATEARDGFVEQVPQSPAFFRSGKSDVWRDALSDAQVARVLRGCEAQMRRFGYWEDGFDERVAHAQAVEFSR
jgi:hypothetical protein